MPEPSPVQEPVVLLRKPFTEERHAESQNRSRRWWHFLGYRRTTPDPVLKDWQAARMLEETGALAGYPAPFVAVLGGQVVGYGFRPGDLREAVARIAQVDPHRVVVMAVDAGESYGCTDSFDGFSGAPGFTCIWEPSPGTKASPRIDSRLPHSTQEPIMGPAFWATHCLSGTAPGHPADRPWFREAAVQPKLSGRYGCVSLPVSRI
jgi:hypothetical protein